MSDKLIEFKFIMVNDHSPMPDRVVITGIGVISPIGHGRDNFFEAMLEGRSGARRLSSPWLVGTGVSTTIGAPIVDFEPAKFGIEAKAARVMDRTSHFAIAAADEALRDARFDVIESPQAREHRRISDVDPSRVAVVVGSGIGGLASLEVAHEVWHRRRHRDGVKRYSLPMMIPNAPAAQISIRYGTRGESNALSTACAAGTMSIGEGFRILQRGDADVVICGGVEGVALDHDCFALMGFDRLKTLSTRNNEPTRASRPFDRDRDGFVLAEGAAILTLEREALAKARGVRPYAVVAGYAAASEGHSMMQLDESATAIIDSWHQALRTSKLTPDDVDFISAHGTSTVQNDRIEARAARSVFGKTPPVVTALKSMTGHAIAGSGALETAAAALSLQRGVITPTRNYENADPDCPVDIVTEPRRTGAEVCLKPSYAFGGHVACLVLTRP